MPSAETKPSRSRFPRRTGFVFATIVAIADPLFAAEAAKPAYPEFPGAFVEAFAANAFAHRTSHSAARNEAIADAQAGLEKFLRDEPTHYDAPYALLQLGALNITAAHGLNADARASASPAERGSLMKQARERIASADGYFSAGLKVVEERIGIGRRGHKPTIDHAIIRKREALKGWYIRSLLGQAEVSEESAATYPAGSPEARTHDRQAADKYEHIYKDFRTLVAGLSARLKQGDCLARLGEPAEALAVYNDVLSSPDDLRPVHELRVAAMAASLACLNSEASKSHEAAFLRGEEYLAQLPREEASGADASASSRRKIRYETARGYLLAAATPRKDGTAPPERAAWLAKAEEHAVKLTEQAVSLTEQSGEDRAAAETLRREIAKTRTVGGNVTK